jgi:hypothetical protein
MGHGLLLLARSRLILQVTYTSFLNSLGNTILGMRNINLYCVRVTCVNLGLNIKLTNVFSHFCYNTVFVTSGRISVKLPYSSAPPSPQG